MIDLPRIIAELAHIRRVIPLAPVRREALRQAEAELRIAAALKSENDELRRELQRLRWQPAPGASSPAPIA